MENNQSSVNNSGATKAQDINLLISQMPANTQDWFYSTETTLNNAEIAKLLNLDEKSSPVLARINGHVILKIIPLDGLVSVIEKELEKDNLTARKIAYEMAIRQFLPIRNHLVGIENFIKSIGGQLPSVMPPIFQPKPKEKIEENKSGAQSAEPDTIIEKHILTALDEAPNLAKQNITEKPLKFSDSENLKFPNIENWITDYKQFRSNFPNQDLALVRTKYLHESPNGKNLSGSERTVVSSILKSLDDKIRLPFSQKTGLLLIDKSVTPTAAPPKQAPVAPAPQPITQTPPRPSAQTTPPPAAPFQPPQSIQRTSPPPGSLPTANPASTAPPQFTPRVNEGPPPAPSKDTYREQVTPGDMSGPQSAARPVPKLNGNVINLKDTSTWQ